MTKRLLRLDASARAEGSCSRALADHFLASWLAEHPGGQVTRRDLAQDPPPHLDQRTIEAFASGGSTPAARLSDALIDELRAADQLLLSAPLYNFGVPSPLKAYFDHVVRQGRTLRRAGGELLGTLGGKPAVVITTRGGLGAPGDPGDHASGHLEALLRFLGLAPSLVQVAGTVADPGGLAARLASTRDELTRLARGAPRWVGRFSDADKLARVAADRSQSCSPSAADEG